MSQSSPPGWLTLLLSGGVVALFFGLLKLVTDAKEDRIKALERQIEDRDKSYRAQLEILQSQHQIDIKHLQRDREHLQQQLDATADLHQLLAKTIDTIRAQGLTGEASFNLQTIEAYLNRSQQGQDTYNLCQNVALWVQRQRDSWLQEISDVAVSRYPNEITSDKIDEFRNDIIEYLTWLYDSLRDGLYIEFSDYAKTRAIDSPFPYRTAFSALQQKDDVGDLTAQEARILREYINELVRRLQS
jgi:hypothetical protein